MPATFTVAEDNKTYDLSGQAAPLMEILQILKAHNIGLNNMIDLRSNPAARQQVQDVVRHAVPQQTPATAPAGRADDGGTVHGATGAVHGPAPARTRNPACHRGDLRGGVHHQAPADHRRAVVG